MNEEIKKAIYEAFTAEMLVRIIPDSAMLKKRRSEACQKLAESMSREFKKDIKRMMKEAGK